MAWRELSGDVPSALLDRGRVRTNPHASGDEPLEWIWPPTASMRYRRFAEWQPIGMRNRGVAQEYQTPWTTLTRFDESARAWRLEYGTALAQEPLEGHNYLDDAEAIADIERMECWPMSVEETHREQQARLWHTTNAIARGDHLLSTQFTEPYGSWIDRIESRRAGGDESKIGEVL